METKNISSNTGDEPIFPQRVVLSFYRWTVGSVRCLPALYRLTGGGALFNIRYVIRLAVLLYRLTEKVGFHIVGRWTRRGWVVS